MSVFDVDLSSNGFKEQIQAVLQCGAVSKKRVQVNCDARGLRSERETHSTCIDSIAEERAEWKVQCMQKHTKRHRQRSPKAAIF